MNIGVLSDTHMMEVNGELEFIIEELFREADLILHAGDLVSEGVMNYLAERGVIAVCGNMDYPSVTAALPVKRIITAEGRLIGLAHGYGPPDRLPERLRAEFGRIDCLVYGHTHQPAVSRQDGELFFNPGSVAGRGRYKPSVGFLHVGSVIEGEIIHLDSVNQEKIK